MLPNSLIRWFTGHAYGVFMRWIVDLYKHSTPNGVVQIVLGLLAISGKLLLPNFNENSSMAKKVVVVGSYNADMTIKTSRIPKPGETIIGGKFSMGAGGKGANQAVAAARAGAEVWFIARIGDDAFGREAQQCLQRNGIHTDYVIHDTTAPTGMAWIVVDEAGENSIIVASGANARLQPCDVEAAKPVIAAAEVMLVQLESPLETVAAAVRLAVACDVRVVFNPAPAVPLNMELLQHISIISPNEVEAEMLTGIEITDEKSLGAAAAVLHEHGAGIVLITLGPRGVYVCTREESYFMPAFKVKAVDTTGAGDIFNGALAAFLAQAVPLQEAVRHATAAAAISVTQSGAQTSAPFLKDIEQFLTKS